MKPLLAGAALLVAGWVQAQPAVIYELGGKNDKSFGEAACLALRQEMTRDARVWALGEDLGSIGGIAGQYGGLQQEFGRERICDTPISESTIMGAAVGYGYYDIGIILAAANLAVLMLRKGS